MYSNKENVNILTALLVSYGIRHIVVCPGSRNAPLVHNFNECPDIICHPVTDERSAGFMALGLRQMLAQPVAVCVTSGSALLNVLPAAAEATMQQQGIIVISADRPQAWIGQLDGQTLPQPGAMGEFVGKCVSLPEPHDAIERWHCNRLVCEAIIANTHDAMPSVHINVPITEPLFEFTVEHLPDERQIEYGAWTDGNTRNRVYEMLTRAKRPMVVIGQLPNGELDDCFLLPLSRAAVVLTEQLAVAQQTFTDQMLYAIERHPEDYRPDFVLYLGGNTVSKRLRQFLRSLDAEQVVVTTDGAISDVSRHTTMAVRGNAYRVIADIIADMPPRAVPTDFIQSWTTLRQHVMAQHSAYAPAYSSMQAVKLFEQRITEDDTVYYANSMSVRLGVIYAKHYIHCNRGVNGIEGSLSAAVGASLALSTLHHPSSPLRRNEGGSSIYCVIGDLSFFYDQNALWQQQLCGNLRILLLNNGQGGIFRNLKGLEQSPARDQLVAASHTTTAEGICHQFNIQHLVATDSKSLADGIQWLTTSRSDRPMLLEVITDPAQDEQVFKAYYSMLR